jgi:4-hydroxy-3-polyprenylbenzoate decarboxylase
MYDTLRDFVAALERAGELKRVSARVSPVLEISEISDRMSKSPAPSLPSPATRAIDARFHHLGGHALLFENVEGSDFPVLINAFGSYRRMEMALGCGEGGLEALADKIGKLVKPEPPPTLLAKLQKLPELMELAKIPPKKVKAGLCQERVLTGDQIDLRRWPLIRCWPLDGDPAAVGYPRGINDRIPGVESGEEWERLNRGRYITLAGIHTIHADDAGNPNPSSRNIGMYRVQLLGKKTMAMHWHMHHDGARHWRSWKAKGERMPVAIVLGGESVLPYAATAPMPPGISELLLAGFLNKGPIPLVDCKTVPLAVPANAEIVIEGWVSHEAGGIGWEPSEVGSRKLEVGSGIGPGAAFEGPFGDHTGFYSLPDRYPLLEVTAITHRRDPIYPTTVVGLPPQEDYFLGKATERLFLPLLKTVVHDIEDYDLPLFGAFHNCAMVRIEKAYPLQGRRVMHSVWGAGQMAWTKSVFVVDDDVNIHDAAEVLRATGERCHPTRDVELVRGPVDILDHASPFVGAGAKLGFDATRKIDPAELHQLDEAGPAVPASSEQARATELRVRALPGVLDARVPDELGGWWLLIRTDKQAAGDGAKVIKALGGITEEVSVPPWTIVVGPDADLANLDMTLFHWLAHMSPERDRYPSDCGRRVAFDSTPKLSGDEAHGHPVRRWPPIIRMSEDVRRLVDGRWQEYGLK